MRRPPFARSIDEPLSPAFGHLHRAIFELVKTGRIAGAILDLHGAVLLLPWWRWLRRAHLERQLALYELALQCYAQGVRRSYGLTAPHS